MGQTLAFADRISLLSFAPGVWVGTMGRNSPRRHELKVVSIGRYRKLFPTINDDAFPRIISLMENMEARGFKLTDLDEQLVNWILKIIFFQYETKDLNAITSWLGLEYNHTIEDLRAADQSLPQAVYTLVYEEQATSTLSPTLSPGSDGMFPTGEFSMNEELSVTTENLIHNPKKDTTIYAYNQMKTCTYTTTLFSSLPKPEKWMKPCSCSTR